MPSFRNMRLKKRPKRDHSLPAGYELTFVTRTDMTDAALKTLSTKVEKIIKDFKGEIHNTEDWGRRKLAYNIGKETRGQYTHYVFTSQPGAVEEIERNLRLQEKVLRFLSVKVSDHFDPSVDMVKPSYILMKPPPRPERDRGDRGGWGDRGDRGDRFDRDRY